MSSMIFWVSLNLTGSVQCILCVDSLVDILVHQSRTFFVIWYFDCCIDCIVFFWSVCLSVSTHCCVNKDYHNCLQLHAVDWLPSGASGPERNRSEREVSGPRRATGREHAQRLVQGAHQTRLDVRTHRGTILHRPANYRLPEEEEEDLFAK